MTIVTYPGLGQEGNHVSMRDKLSEEIVELVVSQIADARKKKGLSHERVAELSGLNRSTISLIESSKRQPTLLSCIRICRALGIKLSDLLAKSQ